MSTPNITAAQRRLLAEAAELEARTDLPELGRLLHVKAQQSKAAHGLVELGLLEVAGFRFFRLTDAGRAVS